MAVRRNLCLPNAATGDYILIPLAGFITSLGITLSLAVAAGTINISVTLGDPTDIFAFLDGKAGAGRAIFAAKVDSPGIGALSSEVHSLGNFDLRIPVEIGDRVYIRQNAGVNAYISVNLSLETPS